MISEQGNIRLHTPDLLKGVAILFMIQVHLIELWAIPAIFTGAKLSLFLGGPPAAPIFMIIMGYFIAKSSYDRITLIKRGFKLIFWGILLNIGLNMNLIYKVLFIGWDFNIWHYVFGVDIFHLAGLSLIIIGLLPKLIKDKWYLIGILIMLIFILQTLLKELPLSNEWPYLTAYLIGGTDWSYFPLIPWLVYPLSGFAFLQLESFFLTWSWHKYYKIFVVLGFFIFTILSWEYAANISSQLKVYYHHGVDFYIWAIIFCLFWAGVFSVFSTQISQSIFGKYLIFTGKNITSIYVIQWLIIGNLATFWYKQIEWPELIFYFFIISALSSLLSYLWNRTKTII